MDHRKACAHVASKSFGKVLPLDYYSAKSVSKNKRPSEKIGGKSWIWDPDDGLPACQKCC